MGYADRLRWLRILAGEEGAALVETAMAFVVMLAMLFGVVIISFSLYTYNYLSEAAREATRYAIVRGSNSCTTSSNNLANCNIGPDNKSVLTSYVQNRGYPGIDGSKLTVDATWWTESTTLDASGNPYHVWTTQCTTGASCNDPGNMVTVKLSYDFPLSIPFWRATTLTMHSTSSMVISN